MLDNCLQIDDLCFFLRARLPDYILDFGYVVLGTVRTHIVRATNTGYFPVSFSADRQALAASGFHVELDRVKQLPGFPDHETVDFRVSFDPRGANVGLGEVETLVPINVSITCVSGSILEIFEIILSCLHTKLILIFYSF